MQTMDEEVRVLAEEAYQRTIDLMEQYRGDVEKVAELLLEQETISHTDVAKLIGDRAFSAGAEYDEFVSTKKKLDDVVVESTSSESGVEAGEGKKEGVAASDDESPAETESADAESSGNLPDDTTTTDKEK